MLQGKKLSEIKWHHQDLLEELRRKKLKFLFQKRESINPALATTATELISRNKESKKLDSKIQHYRVSTFRQKLIKILAPKVAKYNNWKEDVADTMLSRVISCKYAARLIADHGISDSQIQENNFQFDLLEQLAYDISNGLGQRFKRIR